MTTATGNIMVIRETTDGDFELERDGDTWDVYETWEEATIAMADLAAEDREEADDARREALRAEIAELLETVTRIDSLEGLLKSVKRLQG